MKIFGLFLLPAIVIGSATRSQATLIMEPVINFVPGLGPSNDSFPLYDPGFINPATGDQPFLANQPGMIDSVSIGFPTDPGLLVFSVWNNTAYNLTSLRLSIIGSAFNPDDNQESWLITRDSNVDAFFGDANGDGKVGLSDIFSSIVVSNGGRTITLSGGVIPVDGHFTDIAFASTTDGQTFRAGVDTSFDGVVPEPASGALLLTGLGLFWARRVRHRRATIAVLL
jgi:hypothetical protein